MNRALFPEAGAEAADPGSEQEAETRGLDTFGGCLSSLTRYVAMAISSSFLQVLCKLM